MSDIYELEREHFAAGGTHAKEGDDPDIDDAYNRVFYDDYFLNKVMGWAAWDYYEAHVRNFYETRRTYSDEEKRGALDPWNI